MDIKEQVIKNPTDLKLPEPIKDIYDSGFNAQLVRSSKEEAASLVTPDSGVAAARAAEFLNAIEIEEYFTITHTTEAFSSAFRKTTQVQFKDQQKKQAPPALVFLREGEGVSTTYKILPQYIVGDEVATPEFVVTQIHKFFTRRKYIEIETRSVTALTFTYDVFIIKDKFAREYRKLQ